MKPPDKTVTLIDLDGKPIVLKQPVNGTTPTWFKEEKPLKIVGTTDSKPVSFYNFMEARFDSLSGQELLVGLFIEHRSDSYGGYYTDYEDYDYNLESLRLFLNDQLTFIRNGMWKTLAIYQTTLGRYTEVPWYDPKVLEPKHEQNYNVRALDEYDLSKGYFDQEYTDLEGCQYCANAKEFTWAMFVHEHLVIGLDENVPQEITAMAIQPMLEDFIKYYPDVFSKLTPLEGK